ncbi:MAG: tRNA glutamyl-Q(34) synthetase GluQRS [Candidatus Thiodiazotropha sp.]
MSPDNTTPLPYRGRFAPSPTGALHFGSLVAALGSYLDARSQRGQWLLRMEDLDRTREVKGAADAILRSLDAFGFEWDGPVCYQRHRSEAYAEALDRLLQEGQAYACSCSRKQIAQAAPVGDEGPIYPGTCRTRHLQARHARSIRLLTRDEEIAFHDRIQGPARQNIGREIGDFVIRRADGFHAYQLAVVVDDAWQGITRVVRGADLLMSTPRQCHLQQVLGLTRPEYAHLPLAVDAAGRKLSKQHGDAPVDPRRPLNALMQALAFLHQPLPPDRPVSLDEFWAWGVKNWSLSAIPAQPRLPIAPLGHSHADHQE